MPAFQQQLGNLIKKRRKLVFYGEIFRLNSLVDYALFWTPRGNFMCVFLTLPMVAFERSREPCLLCPSSLSTL